MITYIAINKIDNGWLVKWTSYSPNLKGLESCIGTDHSIFCSHVEAVQAQVGNLLRVT